jgi:hypothetical protein
MDEHAQTTAGIQNPSNGYSAVRIVGHALNAIAKGFTDD